MFGWASESEGLDALVRGVQRQVYLCGHHLTRLDAEIDGVPCIRLDKAPHPGSLVALDITEQRQQMRIVAEWPR